MSGTAQPALADQPAAAAGPRAAPACRRAKALAWLRLYGPRLLAIAVLALALLMLDRALRQITYAELAAEIEALPGSRLLLALAGTALSFLALAGYEHCALRFIGKPLPWQKAGLAAFVAQSIAHSTGFAAFVGASLRYRIYAADGLDLADVARVQLFFSTTFVLGVMTLSGLALSLEPAVIARAAAVPVGFWRALGLLLLLAVAGYLALSAAGRLRALALGRLQFELPPAGLTAVQILLAAIDLGAAAAALYVLLPELGISYPAFVGLFTAAIIVGVLSHVPGGLGVFESLLLLMLQPAPAALPAVLGALVTFRAIYYVLTLLAGAGLVGLLEWRHSGARLRQAVGSGLDALSPVAPRLFALLAFLAGIVLLVSGGLPGEPARLAVLGEILPQALIELSHFTGSLVGMALLLLARSLGHRVAEAWAAAIGLLIAGIIASLLKGFDYEEALLLLVVLGALAASRKEFYRRAALLDERLTPPWLVAISLTLLGVVWLISFAYAHVEYAHALWWQVELMADAPRSLRAAVGAAMLLGTAGLMQLLRPARFQPRLPTADELAEAAAIARSGSSNADWLALTGDKALLFNDARDAFVMYGVIGRSWIAMGQPAGLEPRWPELIWRFHEAANRHGGRTVFYEVGAHALPHFLDLGLSILRLGECARVELAGFSLDGRRRANLRYGHKRAQKDGARFEVLPPAAVAGCMAELAAISDAWLATHSTREKRFSLGFFDPAYVARTPVAVVRVEGRIVAFANLWLAGDRSTCSPDLMRYRPDAPKGVMDYLMIETMLWAKAEGYRLYELGMAPLSGLPAHRLAPLWSRLGRLLYRHGANFYNFEGLRAFKDKFDPVWEPVYLFYPRRTLARVLADLAALIAGGWAGVVRK
jgi:phosphatidylglycerol lysyltransferase